MMIFQEIVDSLGRLSTEDRDRLFELIRQQRMEERENEILANARGVFKAVEMGTAKQGTFEDLKSYLLADDEE
jgi:ribosomal 50S subunit-associated protein YjgA (DUF615 family)